MGDDTPRRALRNKNLVHEIGDGMRDRISYSFGMTVNLGRYESARIDVSYASDVQDGETKADALSRVVDFVQEAVSEQVTDIKGSVKNES